MKSEDAKRLIEKAFSSAEKSLWADLGCGTGFFTKVLAGLIFPGSKILALDTNIEQFDWSLFDNSVEIELIKSSLAEYHPPVKLDGVLMANVLHFINDQSGCLFAIKSWLKPGGKLVVIEYDTATPNNWVPYPILQEDLKELLQNSGYEEVELMGKYPSKFQGSMYALEASFR